MRTWSNRNTEKLHKETKLKLEKSILIKQYNVMSSVTLKAGQSASYLVELSKYDIQGYTRIAWTPFSIGQNYINIGIGFVGSNVYFTVTNTHQSADLTFDVSCLIMYATNVNIA